MDNEVLLLGDGEAHQPSLNVVLVLGILFRRRRIMLLTFVAVLLGFMVAKLSHKPVYRATMTLLVNQSRVDPVITSSPAEQLLRDAVDENEINSEVQLVKSHDLLYEVVTNLRPPSSDNRDNNKNLEGSVRQLSSALAVEPVKKSNLIAVTFKSGNPDTAERVLQTLSTLYIQKHAQLRRSHGELAFFQEQADRNAKSLAQAEADLSAFAQRTGTTSPQTERDQVLANLKDANATFQQTSAAIQETQKRLATLKQQASATPKRQTTQLRSADNGTLIQQLRSTLLALELKRTNLLQTYQPDYPLVVEVEQQIHQARSALDAAEKSPIREETTDRDPTYQWITGEQVKAEADLSALRAKAAATAETIHQYENNARDLNQKAIEQSDLLRNLKTQEDNYLLYKRKVEEARLAEALDKQGIVNVVVADGPNRPSFPESSPLLNPLLGLAVAVFASIAIALIVDYLDPSFKSAAELQRVLHVPVLAALPAPGETSTSLGGSLRDSRSLR